MVNYVEMFWAAPISNRMHAHEAVQGCGAPDRIRFENHRRAAAPVDGDSVAGGGAHVRRVAFVGDLGGIGGGNAPEWQALREAFEGPRQRGRELLSSPEVTRQMVQWLTPPQA